MAAKLVIHYDRETDILYLSSRSPYPEQESAELGDDIIVRRSPATGDVESLEILFLSKRDSLELPVVAQFRST
jgi:uncharacterized protein YuzE